jgi:hypothetical protein
MGLIGPRHRKAKTVDLRCLFFKSYSSSAGIMVAESSLKD